MAWTAPVTWVANQTLTAAQLNQQLRDNFLELDVAKAVSVGSMLVATGANTLAERIPDNARVPTAETTNSVGYVALATPVSVTCTTTEQALIMHAARMKNSNVDLSCWASWAISGATVRAAGDLTGISTAGLVANKACNLCDIDIMTTLTPGVNTFSQQYRVSGGTGTFADRTLIVIPL